MRPPKALQPKVKTMYARSLVIVLLLSVTVSGLVAQPAASQDVPASVYTLAGTVTSDKGSPVAGAKLFLQKSGATTATEATADSAGKYKFTGLAAGKYNLTATAACCTHGFLSVTIGGTTIDRTGADINLVSQESPVSGKVANLRGYVREQGTNTAVGGVYIWISNSFSVEGSSEGSTSTSSKPKYGGGYQYFSVVAAPDGFYSINVNVGSIQLNAESEGYDYTMGVFEITKDRILDIPLRPVQGPSVVLKGVLKSTDGTPLGGAYVSVSPDYSCRGDVCTHYADPVPPMTPAQSEGFSFSSRSSSYASTQTGKDGSWSLGTQAGNLRVYASLHGYLPAEKSVTAKDGDNKTVELTLKPIPADSVKVSGKVVDAKDGKPVPFAHVSLENQMWGHYNWTQTDKDGFFSFMTKPGYTLVTISAWRSYYTPCGVATPEPDYAADAPAEEPSSASTSIREPGPSCQNQEREKDYFPRILTINGGEGDSISADAKLVAKPDPDAEILGWVVNASSKKGVPGATVMVYNELTHDYGHATTDKDGSYRVKVTAGYFTLRVHSPGFFEAALNAEVASGGKRQLNIMLEPGERAYGGCCYYGSPVAVMEDYGSSAPKSGPGGFERTSGPSGDGGFSSGSGANAYIGEGGGLGPYNPDARLSSEGGGKSPGAGLMLVVLAMAAALLAFGRRRA
jgi:hypothetical protein